MPKFKVGDTPALVVSSSKGMQLEIISIPMIRGAGINDPELWYEVRFPVKISHVEKCDDEPGANPRQIIRMKQSEVDALLS